MSRTSVNIDTVIIGAGQAGLAVSWHLRAGNCDHVVLERGAVGERWRNERWDSLRTLTPNWMSRLPGYSYSGDDPDGFMTMQEVVGYFESYATSFDAPVVEHAPVRSVTADGHRFAVVAGGKRWLANNVVIATGWADQPQVPSVARRLPSRVQQLTPSTYRRPDDVRGDRVLVVGASASGSQLAAELRRSGRDVTVAVGRHRRIPRRYRGHDIMWWLDRLGTLDRQPGDAVERDRLLREPSLQLSADPTLDLSLLGQLGATMTGRLVDISDGQAIFAEDLAMTMAESELRLQRLLHQIDELAGDGPGEDVPAVEVSSGPRSKTLGRGGIDSVLWATGFRRSYPWLHLPVIDTHGDISHEGGVTPIPGLYVAGMRFQSGRRSTFIDGARFDAPVVASQILRRTRALVAA